MPPPNCRTASRAQSRRWQNCRCYPASRTSSPPPTGSQVEGGRGVGGVKVLEVEHKGHQFCEGNFLHWTRQDSQSNCGIFHTSVRPAFKSKGSHCPATSAKGSVVWMPLCLIVQLAALPFLSCNFLWVPARATSRTARGPASASRGTTSPSRPPPSSAHRDQLRGCCRSCHRDPSTRHCPRRSSQPSRGKPLLHWQVLGPISSSTCRQWPGELQSKFPALFLDELCCHEG